MAIEQQIKVAGQDIALRSSALTPRLYRVKFGRDLMVDMRTLRDALDRAAALPADATPEKRREAELTADELTIFEDVAYIMAKQADESLPDAPEEWLDSINGVFFVYQALPMILKMWNMNSHTTSTLKKKRKPTTREMNGAIFMLRCAELGLSDDALRSMTVGMVSDMLIERSNDREKYPDLATQEDFDAF